jgi:hypothetical protein
MEYQNMVVIFSWLKLVYLFRKYEEEANKTFQYTEHFSFHDKMCVEVYLECLDSMMSLIDVHGLSNWKYVPWKLLLPIE